MGGTMARQRLLCVGLLAVMLGAALPAKAAETSEGGTPVAGAKKKVAPKKANAKRMHHRVAGKRIAAKTKAGPPGSTKAVPPGHAGERAGGQIGFASWYGAERHGRPMASGAKFDKDAFTAAHRTLPLHSSARVINMANGRSVIVRITDRGPSRKGRIIDVSQSAAEVLGMRNSGISQVRIEPVVAGTTR
jgi:rare lipoprotein A